MSDEHEIFLKKTGMASYTVFFHFVNRTIKQSKSFAIRFLNLEEDFDKEAMNAEADRILRAAKVDENGSYGFSEPDERVSPYAFLLAWQDNNHGMEVYIQLERTLAAGAVEYWNEVDASHFEERQGA